MRNKTLILLLIITIMQIRCNYTEIAFEDNRNFKQWVYVELIYIMKSDTTTNFYYGQINEEALDRINKNNLDGFFQLRNIRYLDKNDKLAIYESKIDMGRTTFKIASIVRIDFEKDDPIYTYSFSDLDDNSKAYFEKNKKK